MHVIATQRSDPLDGGSTSGCALHLHRSRGDGSRERTSSAVATPSTGLRSQWRSRRSASCGGPWSVGDSWFQLFLAAALGSSSPSSASSVTTRPPADVPVPRLERVDLAPAGGPLRRAGLRLVEEQAQPAPHLAQPGGAGSGHRSPDPSRSRTPLVEDRDSRFGRWFLKRQGWLFFPLLSLEGLNLHARACAHCLHPARSRHRRLGISCWLRARLTTYVAALVVLLPPTKAAAFFAVQMGVFGLCLGALVRAEPQGDADRPSGTRRSTSCIARC